MAPALLLPALLLLPLLLSPEAALAAPALTVPPNGISGCTVLAWAGPNGVQSQAASPQTTPTPDGLDVALGATASDGASFPGLYLGSFSVDCALLGAGSLGYGGARGTLSLTASSTPDALEPEVNNPNDPFRNDSYARGEGLLTLQFDDTGVVTSNVLANGTPVQLDFTFLLESVAVATGAPLGPLLAADATYFVHAGEVDPPGASVDWILSGNDLVTRPLATTVGRKIDVQGKLALHVLARAGREVPGALYYGDLDAAIDASNTSSFTIATPANVTFVAESGHDYTVPAPARALLLATGALVLAVAGRRRAAPPREPAPAPARP